MRDNDQDWRLLNAYADGELDAARTADIEARLRAELDLKRDLDRIEGLKQGLSLLRPPNPTGGTKRWAAKNAGLRPFGAVIAATAAVLVIVAVGAMAMLVWTSEQPTWLARAMAMHDRLSLATYVVDEHHVTQVVSSGHALEFRAPDLTESRLYLVDVVAPRSDGVETIAMHYRGMRGCRLTLVAIHDPLATAAAPLPVDSLVRTWSYGGYNFAVIAMGMDPQRFASVAEYLEATIVDDARRHENLQIAMAERYDTALPCA